MSKRTAIITMTNDKLLPFLLNVNGNDYQFPNYVAAEKYARNRFVSYEIINQTERGKENK